MTKKSFVVMALVLGSSVVAGWALSAQINLKAEIPFDFVVGNRTLAAGTYLVSSPPTMPGVLFIRSEDSKYAVMTQSRGVIELRRDETPRLEFNRYGATYCLAKVWDGSTDGREIPKSKFEREVANASRATAPLASIVAIRVR
jgi:hypothetical protein